MIWKSTYRIKYVRNTFEYHYVSQSNIGGGNRTNQYLRQLITLFQRKTGFHLACEKEHTETVNLLLARDDLDVNIKDQVSQHTLEISLICLTHTGGEHRTNQYL